MYHRHHHYRRQRQRHRHHHRRELTGQPREANTRTGVAEGYRVASRLSSGGVREN